ncbi:MAG: hypothetical protein WAU86_22375, partial [Oricola sp.]
VHIAAASRARDIAHSYLKNPPSEIWRHDAGPGRRDSLGNWRAAWPEASVSAGECPRFAGKPVAVSAMNSSAGPGQGLERGGPATKVRTGIGGPDADISPRESAADILRIARETTIADTGTFVNYDGSTIPW